MNKSYFNLRIHQNAFSLRHSPGPLAKYSRRKGKEGRGSRKLGSVRKRGGEEERWKFETPTLKILSTVNAW